jgi:hypothetical protein
MGGPLRVPVGLSALRNVKPYKGVHEFQPEIMAFHVVRVSSIRPVPALAVNLQQPQGCQFGTERIERPGNILNPDGFASMAGEFGLHSLKLGSHDRSLAGELGQDVANEIREFEPVHLRDCGFDPSNDCVCHDCILVAVIYPSTDSSN